MIRRLLTPEIAKRATIFDVCIDRWVNQGCAEPLVKIAEKMTSEALLKTRKLGPPKMYSDRTNEIKEQAIEPPTSVQQNKEKIIVNGRIADLKCPQSEATQKSSLFEQMLKYDVNFVMNQLLSAFESSNTTIDKNASQSENLISALKPRNGENTGKVESAYVIPIFEVTSVMPKLLGKNIKNSNCEKSSQMCFSRNTAANESEILSTSENKNNKPKIKKKLLSNLNQPYSTTTDGNLIHNGVEHSNLANNFKKQNEDTVTELKASIKQNQVKLLVPNENTLPRLPSIKMKKSYENQLLFGPKKQFFRSKNHSLSLARIYSMKYEKLVLDALKAPERKQKPPGKITIPPTFDPSTPCDETPERKEIVLLLPTVSVSENKQKIEKKIDKIKKAALNMNLIRRSNTNNRLRIQKFLRSQAKKMQDLVCDEHRSLAGSMEYIDQINGFPTNFCTFEKGNLNPFNMKHHNKKINFMNSNLSNPINPFAFDISHGDKWKLFGSENFLMEDKENLAIFGIAKSKSDIQFPTNYSEYNMTNSSYRSSYSSGYNSLSNTLSVPNSDCCLLRSASDSDGLNYFRNTPTMCASKQYIRCALENASEVHYNEENDNFDILLTQNESENFPTSDGEQIQNVTISNDLSQNAEMDVVNVHKNSSRNTECLNKRNTENYTIRRSISTSNCLSSQKISGNDLQNIKRLLLTPSLIKKNNQFINNTNNGLNHLSPLHLNVLGENKTIEEDREYLRQYSINEYRSSIDENINLTWNEIKSKGPNEIFNNYLWLPHGKLQLLTLYQQNGGKCLSSPNLIDLDADKNIDFPNDGISINGFNIRAIENDDILGFTPFSQIVNMQKSMKSFTQSRQRLQNSDNVDEAFYDFPTRYNRSMSINDDSHISLESLLEYERKLSLPQGSLGKAPFLSKFLNDLERRDNVSSSLDNNSSSSTQKTSQRKPFKAPKRSKLEKRSQSFLQLLALKRIQEAEKELEKVERNNRIEDEDESGSLLEALKTHGYKGVISQRFQNQDDDAMLPLNLRNPKSKFLTRNYSPDMSYFNSMDYDTSPYRYSPYEDDNLDLEMVNGVPMQSFYEIYPGYRQTFPKQYIYDWLTANQNNEYSTTPRVDSIFEPEILNTKKEPESPSYWSKESPRSFDEASSSESFEFPKDQATNGKINNEHNSTRHTFTDNGECSNYARPERNQLFRTPSAPERYENYSKYASLDRNLSEDNDEFSNHVRSERNPLLRTASAPEEEKEESVQDRIWRKSFYSRFNNSVLSRKERSSFLDTCDSRAGYRERSLTPFKTTSRLERSVSNGYQSKRHSKRRSSTSSDRTLDSGLSASIKHIPLERTATNTTLTNEMEDTDPEH